MLKLSIFEKRHSSTSANNKLGATEVLARELSRARGPTSEEIFAFKKAVGWREQARGSDVKVNHRAEQLLKRHVKRFSEDGQISGLARRRIEDYFPVDDQIVKKQRDAKKAHLQEPDLRLKIAQLEDRLGDVERERDTLRLEKLRLRNAFEPYFVERSDNQSIMNEGVPRHARRSSRSLRTRPYSAHIFSMPPLPDELTTREHAHGTISSDVNMHEPTHDDV